MLKTIQSKIRITEQVYALAKNKMELNNKYLEKYYFWLGVSSALKDTLKDLKEIQEVAENDVSDVDHCLDKLRGL